MRKTTTAQRPTANASAHIAGGLMLPLFVVLAVLKMSGTVGWSWWIVTAPLWIPWLLFIAVFVVVLLGVGLFALAKTALDERKRKRIRAAARERERERAERARRAMDRLDGLR